jgi:hypothetical protein
VDSSLSSGARLLLLESSATLLLSWGSQRPSLHRHTLQVSSPGHDSLRTRSSPSPSTKACHCLGTVRPCRSSRLRRLSPPGRCRLVASCSRSWDSPRFGWLGWHRPVGTVPSRLGSPSRSLRSRGIVGSLTMFRLVLRASPLPSTGWSTVRPKPVHLALEALTAPSPAAVSPRTLARRVWVPDAGHRSGAVWFVGGDHHPCRSLESCVPRRAVARGLLGWLETSPPSSLRSRPLPTREGRRR